MNDRKRRVFREPSLWRQMVKSKTMWLAKLLVIFGVIETNLPMFKTMVGDKYYPLLFTVVGVLVALCRMNTTTSLGEK